MDTSLAQEDPLLEEILIEVYKIGQELRDKEAAKKKAREEPEEWQRYMRSFQAAFSPVVARFKSTIEKLIDQVSKELEIASSSPTERETVEESDAGEEDPETPDENTRGAINQQSLETTKDELEKYQNL